MPFPQHQQFTSVFISRVSVTTNTSVYMATYVMYSIQAACFIFPRLVAPCSPFPPPPEPSLFPSAPFLALGMGGFLWGRTFLLILLRDNQSLPAVLSLCSPCTGNFFFCISVNCLATHSFAQAEAQYQPRPHPHSMARSGPW